MQRTAVAAVDGNRPPDVWVALSAGPTQSAVFDRSNSNRITYCKVVDPITEVDDGAGEFVTEDHPDTCSATPAGPDPA